MNDIVIVNWNSGRFLKECIESIVLSPNVEFVHHIFIVDNNSGDESLQKVIAHDKIRIIQNKQNVGFARACNQGFIQCSRKYVLLLNPDTRLFPDTLAKCHSFMDRNPEHDILGCQLVDGDGGINLSCARFPTPLRYFYDATGLSRVAPGIFKPAILMADWDHRDERVVDQVMGAFMFMRRTVFEKIGFFDPQFFVYLEEMDFSRRLVEAGGTSFFTPSIRAYHYGGGSSENVKAYRLFLNLRSRRLYSKKHFSKIGHVFLFLTTFLIEPVSKSIFFLLSGKPSEIFAMVKAYKMLVTKKDISNAP